MPEQGPGTLLSTLSSRFELRGLLGAGSTGVVHRAIDHHLRREVALKTLRTNSPELFHHLKEEFRAAASIVHPNLIELHQLFVHGCECFFTMELLDAVPFDRWVREAQAGRAAGPQKATGARGSAPASCAESGTRRIEHIPDADIAPVHCRLRSAEAAARLAWGSAQLVRAVAALHDAGRIHCDLKPSNILVTRGGRLVVLDFGLSSPRWGQLARPGFSGTLAYAAPEQMWGGTLTAATDWYSVGVVLFQALTGDLPDGDGQLQATLARTWDGLDAQTRARLPAQLVSLIAELLQLDPSQRPARDAVARVLDPAPKAQRSSAQERHFVGRAVELDTLQRAFLASRAGWLTVVEVRGESGIGKTELVRQFTLQAIDDEALVVRGQCRLDESVPYQALDHAIDDLCQHLGLLPKEERRTFLPDDFASLVRVFPVLGCLARTEKLPDDLEGTVIRQRAVVALRQLLWRLCAWRPLVLWVDDANWGDAESQSLLCELLREPAPPLLLILSHRDPGAPWLTAIAEAVAEAKGQWVELGLRPLDDDASHELVGRLLGSLAREQPALTLRVAAAGEHVPLFIGQLCRLIAETARPGEEVISPLTLFQVIERRVAALTADERRLAEVVALIDSPLPIDVVARAAGLSAKDGVLVSRLASAQLLRLAGARPNPKLGSFHHHVRDTILARLDPASRRRGHRSLAAALERLDTDTVPEVLLHHWLGAGETERAVEVALRAARAAMDKLAFAHAATLYRTALELLGGTEDHQALRSELARALSASGRAVEAGEQYLALAERATPQHSVRWLQRAAESFLVGGELGQGFAVLERALRHMGLPLPASRATTLLNAVRRVVTFRVRAHLPSRGSARGPDARELLRADLCLSAAKGLSVVDPMLSAHFAFLALSVAASAQDPTRLASALCLAGMMLAAVGGPLGRWGQDWLAQAARTAEAQDDALLRGRVLVCRAQVAVNAGRWPAVLEQCDAAICWLAVHPDATWERNVAHMAALRALEELGELERACQRASEWRADAHGRGDLYAQTTAELYLAFARLAAGESEQAESLAQLALARWSRAAPPFQEFYKLRVLAYAALQRGRPRAALAHLENAERTLKAAGLEQLPTFVLDANLLAARLHVGLAREAVTPKALAAAENACRHALERLDRLQRSDASAYAALTRAGLWAVRGSHGAAREQLQDARVRFAEQNMKLGLTYVEIAERALDRQDGTLEPSHELSLRRKGVAACRPWLALHAPGFA